MDVFPPHIIEWFVVPLAMYLLLFWWRDNLNILHRPLADLVALLVIADVAIALNLRCPKCFDFCTWMLNGTSYEIALSGAGIFLLFLALRTCSVLFAFLFLCSRIALSCLLDDESYAG